MAELTRKEIVIALAAVPDVGNGWHVARLAGLDLAGLDLSGLNLAHVDFRGSNLSGCKLIGCCLEGANFDHADLTDADLSAAQFPDESEGDTTIFRGAKLLRAKFCGACCTGANFEDADLTEADFTGANIADADLLEAKMDGTRFIDTNAQDVRIRTGGLDRAIIRGGCWVGLNSGRNPDDAPAQAKPPRASPRMERLGKGEVAKLQQDLSEAERRIQGGKDR